MLFLDDLIFFFFASICFFFFFVIRKKKKTHKGISQRTNKTDLINICDLQIFFDER